MKIRDEKTSETPEDGECEVGGGGGGGGRRARTRTRPGWKEKLANAIMAALTQVCGTTTTGMMPPERQE